MSDDHYIDAYCHIGLPRFGSAENAMVLFDQWQIEKNVSYGGANTPSITGAMRRCPLVKAGYKR